MIDDPGWKLVSLADVATLRFGATPSRAVPHYWADKSSGYAWASIADLRTSPVLKTAERISPEGVRGSSVSLAKAGTLLMSFKLTIGRVALAGVDLYTNEAIVAIEGDKENVDERWLYHVLPRVAGTALVDTAVKGATLNKAKLEQIPLSLPPIGEQRMVADVLDSIDKSIRSTERIIAKLELLKRGTFQEFLYGGGNPTVAWPTVRLHEVGSINGGVTLGRKISGPGTVELPYLRVANVKDGYIDTSDVKSVRVLESEIDRYDLRPGDVLMTEGGDFDKLGRGAVWDGRIDPCLHQNHIFRVRCDTQMIVPEFLSLYSGSPIGRRWFASTSKQTTNLASISRTQLESFPIPYPPIADQCSIIDRVVAIQEGMEKASSRVVKLRVMKQGLMDDLLTGRVRVMVDVAG
jgi:type I restriction enzyme S subunit